VAVVSVPRYLSPGEDWLAGPHEIGHKVYWNLADLNNLSTNHSQLWDDIEKKIKKVVHNQKQQLYLVGVMKSWLEEMFADVYGTLVAQERFCESIMDILKQQVENIMHLLANDDDHPFPYLRPLLRLETLRQMGGKYAGQADKLEQNWKDIVKETFGEIDETYQREFYINDIALPENKVTLPLNLIRRVLIEVVTSLLTVAQKIKRQGLIVPIQQETSFQQYLNVIKTQARQGQTEYELSLSPMSSAFAQFDPAAKHNLWQVITWDDLAGEYTDVESPGDPLYGWYTAGDLNLRSDFLQYRYHRFPDHTHNTNTGKPTY
jgi:hypothetical protein